MHKPILEPLALDMIIFNVYIFCLIQICQILDSLNILAAGDAYRTTSGPIVPTSHIRVLRGADGYNLHSMHTIFLYSFVLFHCTIHTYALHTRLHALAQVLLIEFVLVGSAKVTHHQPHQLHFSLSKEDTCISSLTNFIIYSSLCTS